MRNCIINRERLTNWGSAATSVTCSSYFGWPMRQFAIFAAAEAGGEAAVDRLLGLRTQGSLERETEFYALGRTGSERAAKAIIDALPYLQDGTVRYAALRSLATLTHHESREDNISAQTQQWNEWWAKSQNRKIYKPRDWRIPLTPLN